jgi:hypothetical protein
VFQSVWLFAAFLHPEEVPAESTTTDKPNVSTFFRNSPSAIGDRQMFPRQTIKIFTGVKVIKAFLFVCSFKIAV